MTLRKDFFCAILYNDFFAGFFAKSGISPTLCFLRRVNRGDNMETGRKDGWKSLRAIVEGLGYECVGIALVTEERAVFLRVFIDSVGGIQVRDCEIVSKAVSAFLDEHEEYIPGKYFLEVSSPGIERPLFTPEDYKRFIGKKARLRVRLPVQGRKSLSGLILSADDDAVELEIDADTPEEMTAVRIAFDIITKGNLAFEEKKDKRRNS